MRRFSFPIVTVILCLVGASALAHCQLPCGIYDDAARFAMMKEHVTTIEKAMNETVRLSAEAQPNMNQIVRWISNKDSHADELAEIVTAYFMAQRIKPAPADDAEKTALYTKQLSLLHRILVHAMKAKQTTDLAHVEALRKLIAEFEASYFAK